jgi:hypothetical protein
VAGGFVASRLLLFSLYFELGLKAVLRQNRAKRTIEMAGKESDCNKIHGQLLEKLKEKWPEIRTKNPCKDSCIKI